MDVSHICGLNINDLEGNDYTYVFTILKSKDNDLYEAYGPGDKGFGVGIYMK